MKKYKWNKKKCFKNIITLIINILMLLVTSFIYVYVILGFCGIDILF